MPVSTSGDRDKVRPIAELGPRGVFAAELQRALLDGAVDVAVHSLKDLPGVEPPGLELAAFPQRADAADVLVSRDGSLLTELPSGARVGTSSSRRVALLAVLRPDLVAVPIRGNVGTRIAKVDAGDYDGAVLAAAGLDRLGVSDRISERLDPEVFVPSPGQGALAIERRTGELAWIADAGDPDTTEAVAAERRFMVAVEAGCEMPVGAWARRVEGELTLDGFVGDPDGRAHYRGRIEGDDPDELGAELARRLLASGAADLIADR